MHDPGKHNLLLLPISKVTGMGPMKILVLTVAVRTVILVWTPALQPKDYL